MRTKPRGMWANFVSECVECRDEITVSNGRPEPHQCEAEE